MLHLGKMLLFSGSFKSDTIFFVGEQHGFRKAENIQKALDGEFYFFSKVFGFEAADCNVEVTPRAKCFVIKLHKNKSQDSSGEMHEAFIDDNVLNIVKLIECKSEYLI